MENVNWYGVEEHRIRIAEVDSNGSMAFHAMLNLMQEVAWNNSEALGYSVYHLLEKGVTWVVNRMQFHIYRYPRHYEKVTVKSWPSAVDKWFTYRDYSVTDEQGQVIVEGTSRWVVMDIEKRRPAPVKGNFDLVFPEAIKRMAFVNDKLQPTQQGDSSIKTVGYTDTDQNHHTNNAKYIEWALEHLYQVQGKIEKPVYVDMQFKGESVVGDELAITAETLSDNDRLLSIHNNTRENTTFLALVRLAN